MTMKFRIHVDADSSVRMEIGSTGEQLYQKWKASDSEEDWQELVDWIADDVAMELGICIEDIEELT
jgi:hypothetical protein